VKSCNRSDIDVDDGRCLVCAFGPKEKKNNEKKISEKKKQID